ncbi:hypothetical protein BDV33DRAFT_205713 [Aspergillus novoparasiticus]|uniref:Uncharacterized protein n=1 Tax=Aspergillus novoparasiticus TaxID=986946 RepID=A0A5N6EKB8_9EURO|nr:hypothetical protein BDV33DRAFT_205713 [Aspergillus novoparasiticus]
MKFLQNCSVLAVLVAFSNAASISTSPRQISTTEDIPELPERFTWRIVERPVGNDTNISRATETAELKQLQKRILAVGCVGIQNYQQTLLVQPGDCHEATYGTCLTYAIINHCVDNGEAGYGYDNEDNEYEIGIEHSGDQLPSYIC